LFIYTQWGWLILELLSCILCKEIKLYADAMLYGCHVTLNCKDTWSIDDEQLWSIGGTRVTKENRNTRNTA